ncbi:MAG: hypothetical protein PHY47_11990 [Lachnospiraceae bacterium]|nr:hypothetical protein [Lachnospiraceae bacterium]
MEKEIIKLISEILKNDITPIFIGIDGMCASGKTTLGYYLKNEFDCNLFHMDDFFLQEHQRTQARLNEIGGNVDYERFKEEVITPIFNKQSIKYRPYKCSLGAIQAGEVFSFKRLNIIEGSYCQHPYFGDIYQIKIFMTISDDNQIERIRIRNGDRMLERFLSEWIPKENEYFDKYRVRESSILI